MNWTTAIMLFLAWQLLSQNTQSAPKIQDIEPFLNDDTKGILDGVSKLASPTATSEDKTGAIFQMMTNPTVMSFAQNLFGNGADDASQTPPKSAQTTQQTDATFTTQQGATAVQSPKQPSATFASATTETHNSTNSPMEQFADQTQSIEPTPATHTPQSPTEGFVCAPTQNSQQNTMPPQNDEGYTFASPTERARQFFAPIDTITTAEIKHKLCYFYDNWYLAK